MTIEEATLNAIDRIAQLDQDISELDTAIADTYKIVAKVERNMRQRKDGLHDKVCCYCGVVFGEIKADNLPLGLVSHGICPSCVPVAEKELQKALAKK